jgi:hypothetical protein
MYVGSDTVRNSSPRTLVYPSQFSFHKCFFHCHLGNEQWACYMPQFHIESHPAPKIKEKIKNIHFQNRTAIKGKVAVIGTCM